MPARLGSEPVRISHVSSRIERALEELRQTDQPAGSQSVDGAEASRAVSPLARQAWSAGSTVWGKPYTTPSATGWVPRLTAADPLSFQDLQNLKNQALRVLVSITPVGSDEVPPSAFEDLPAKVQAYWDSTFKPGSLFPEQRDALVALIRAAAAELE